VTRQASTREISTMWRPWSQERSQMTSNVAQSPAGAASCARPVHCAVERYGYPCLPTRRVTYALSEANPTPTTVNPSRTQIAPDAWLNQPTNPTISAPDRTDARAQNSRATSATATPAKSNAGNATVNGNHLVMTSTNGGGDSTGMKNQMPYRRKNHKKAVIPPATTPSAVRAMLRSNSN
jgi:hypothetical protein